MRFALALVLVLPALAQDPREIILRTALRDQNDQDAARNYTYLAKEVDRYFDGKDQLKSTESKTHEVLILYGRPYRRLVAEDGKPLPEDRVRKEQEKLDKEMAKRAKESEKDRRKREQEEAKRLEDAKALVREVADAFDFTIAGEEPVDGRLAWIIDAEPKPGYKPRSRRAGILPKMRGRLWITQDTYRWVKVEAEVLDTISFGWFVFRLDEGARMRFEQRQVEDGLWMPHSAWFRGDARVALVKRFNVESEMHWSDYRKFQTESRVVATEEVPVEPEDHQSAQGAARR